MELTLLPLIDDQKCFETVRRLRWPTGVACPHCESMTVTKRGMDETQACRQRYHCGGCHRQFDDLTGTIFAGHHQPLRVWLLCLYFMGLNLSNRQIARELSLDEDSTHDMASQLREGIVARQPAVVLSDKVECDEVYVVAGHKGHPEAVYNKKDDHPSKAIKRSPRTRHVGQREASDIRDDSTRGDGRHADAGERQASHNRPTN